MILFIMRNIEFQKLITQLFAQVTEWQKRKEVRGLSLNHFTKDQLREMAFIDVAYHFIQEKKEVLHFSQLMDVVSTTLGLSEHEKGERISQFYTDLNVDGRFLSLGENRWGLRSWYPIDKVDDEAVLFNVPKKKKKKKKAKDGFDDYEELDEDLEDDLLDDAEDIDEDDDEDEDNEDQDMDEDDDLDADYEEFDEEELLEEEELDIDEEFDDEEMEEEEEE